MFEGSLGENARFDFNLHLATNIDVEVDGDRAESHCRVFKPVTYRGEAHWMAGANDAEYVRADGRWFVTWMRVTNILSSPYAKGWAEVPYVAMP